MAGAPYEPRLLALREGPLLEAAVLALQERPDALIVNATGRDHARRAGLALQLEGETVGCWLRTRRGTRPLAVHPGWRLDTETASALVLAHSCRRTPEPLRLARSAARAARARSALESGPP